MWLPCNSCGVCAASGKHLSSGAQAGKAVRILLVPFLRRGSALNQDTTH